MEEIDELRSIQRLGFVSSDFKHMSIKHLENIL